MCIYSRILFLSLQLSTENREVWEESLQCLSLLVGLYGGQGEDCLSRSCLQSFLHVLRTHTQHETTRSALEIINHLVNIHETRSMCEEAVASLTHRICQKREPLTASFFCNGHENRPKANPDAAAPKIVCG